MFWYCTCTFRVRARSNQGTSRSRIHPFPFHEYRFHRKWNYFWNHFIRKQKHEPETSKVQQRHRAIYHDKPDVGRHELVVDLMIKLVRLKSMGIKEKMAISIQHWTSIIPVKPTNILIVVNRSTIGIFEWALRWEGSSHWMWWPEIILLC